MPDIGERVQNVRRLRMWTQARLAKEAGVSPTTVSGIETGKIGRPHFGTLGKLARALDVAPEDLLYSREGSEQGRFIKRQIREVAGGSGSVKASAMVRRNQDEAKRKDEHARDSAFSKQSRNPGLRDKTP